MTSAQTSRPAGRAPSRALTPREQSRELAPQRQLSFSASEVVGLILISVGAFAIPIVAPIVGLVLLWRSRIWRRADKGVATALVMLPVVATAGAVGLLLLLRWWNFG